MSSRLFNEIQEKRQKKKKNKKHPRPVHRNKERQA